MSNTFRIKKSLPAGRQGFTLIELLLAITIVVILGSIVVVSVSSSRPKTRDTKRIEEVKVLKGAIELYFANNGQYPSVTFDGNVNLISTLQPFLVPNYTAVVPQDPLYPGVNATPGDYEYIRGSAGSYGIGVYLETAQGSVPAKSRCLTGSNVSTFWFGSAPACPF